MADAGAAAVRADGPPTTREVKRGLATAGEEEATTYPSTAVLPNTQAPTRTRRRARTQSISRRRPYGVLRSIDASLRRPSKRCGTSISRSAFIFWLVDA